MKKYFIIFVKKNLNVINITDDKKYEYLKIVIALLLFILPFFWYHGGNLLLGEDDVGLIYLDPINNIKTMVGISTWWSSGNIAVYNPLVIYEIPFALFLTIIRFLTFGLVNLQQFAFGLILSLSFIFIVNLMQFFTKQKSSAFFIAGLFYSLSPSFFVMEYFYLMPSTFNIALYPILSYFFLKGYETHKNRYYLIGSIFTFIFARSFFNPPYGVAFFSLSLIFLVVYNQIKKRKFIYLLREIIKNIFFIILINAFLFIQIIYSLFLKNNAILGVLNEKSIVEQSFIALSEQLKQPKILDFLLNVFPSASALNGGIRMFPIYLQHLNNVKFLGVVILIVILIALVANRKNDENDKKLILFFSGIFLITFACTTVTILPFGEKIFNFLFKKIPYFHMWRYPYAKFNITFLFYYLITFGFSLFFIYKIIKKRYIKLIISFMLLTILFILSKPFITGDFVNKVFPPFTFTREMKLNDTDFLDATLYLKNINDDGNVFWFPMGYGYAMFIPTNGLGAYRGPTPLKFFTSKTIIGNIQNLSYAADTEIEKLAKEYYFELNDESLLKLAKKLNFKYIMVFKDVAKLSKFAEIIPSQTHERKGYYRGVVSGIPIYENKTYKIYKIKNYNDISKFTTFDKNSDIIFKKISDYYYQIAIKTDGPDKIVFNEPYSMGWEFFKITKEKFNCENPKNLSLNNKNVLECDHTNENSLSLKNSLYLFKNKTNFVNTSSDPLKNIWEINTNNEFEYFDLFFSGQKYVDIGIVISIITLLGYSAYIIYDLRKSRRIIILKTNKLNKTKN